LRLQVSAQNQEVTVKETGAKNAGKAKQNKLGAFAKMLDGLRVKLPQSETVGNKAKRSANEKVSLKEARSGVLYNAARTDKAGSEKKKKSPSEIEGAEAGAFLAGKPADSVKNTKKTVSQTAQNNAVRTDKEILSVETGKAGNTEDGLLSFLKENKITDNEKSSGKNSVKIDAKQKKSVDNAVQSEISALNQSTSAMNSVKNPQNSENIGDLRLSKAHKRRESSVIEVKDARTTDINANIPGQIQQVTAVHADADGKTIDITLDLSQGRANDAPESVDQKIGNRNFAEMLSNALADNLSNDIVRQASIVLRDGGQGTIRLFLKPETLGSVKIRLELAENKITGHIIVDSEEALRAFEKEVHSLEQAFKDSGFESASLNAGFASGDGNAKQWNGSETRPFFSERFAAEQYGAGDEASGFAETDGFGLDASVNMLA
jgi:flagellar hook-length control protein FliK